MSPGIYQVLRAGVAAAGYSSEIARAQTVCRPHTAEAMADELVWAVLNSGMRNQVARGIWRRLRPALHAGESAHDHFRHRGKADAIDFLWRERDCLFAALRTIRDPDLPGWCETLPWIGSVTCWHAAKNLGADVAKPDRWLERVAARSSESVQDLCQRLAVATGDRIATVDLVIWRACNLGLLRPEDPVIAAPHAGESRRTAR